MKEEKIRQMVVVACSATESVTSGSVVVKNGLIEFRYLKLGKGRKI